MRRQEKRKLILEEISEIKRKKLDVEQCILSLKTGIEKYSIHAEKKQDMSLLTKANSFRKMVIEKENIVKTFGKAIEKLSDNSIPLKSI